MEGYFSKGKKINLFDFFHCMAQNAYIAIVILSNEVRYEGSLCKTKEEASKSAASMALLCLVSKKNQFMVSFFQPHVFSLLYCFCLKDFMVVPDWA